MNSSPRLSSSASRYAELRVAARVQERALFPSQKFPSELELQARWFAGDFGRKFQTLAGDEIEIAQFGVWNREAGPDFSDAAIRFGNGEAIRGSIEFDLEDRSWETHGHATNPEFEDVVLHVFVHASASKFFSRTQRHREVAQIQVDPFALPDMHQASAALAQPGRCRGPLQNESDARVESILQAAAHFRLERKATRLRTMVEGHGRDAALFFEIAAALGYKQNKLPFTLVAQRLGLDFLRARSDECEALLFGVAGFLDEPDLARYRDDARSYVRELWNFWWPHRAEMQRLIPPKQLWKLTGTRPANHPQRRLGALAALVREWPKFLRAVESAEENRVRKFFADMHHPFWNFHFTLTSARSEDEMALLGESRAAEILANVLFPFWRMRHQEIWSAYEKQPARLTNRRLETAAARLFADDPRRKKFTRTLAQQQGLLQIYEDFCLQDNSDCAHCPFPEQMRRWSVRD